jgi:hypothetical protein
MMLNLNNILYRQVSYFDLLDQDKFTFQTIFNKLYDNMINNHSITGSIDVDYTILKYLFIYIINVKIFFYFLII